MGSAYTPSGGGGGGGGQTAAQVLNAIRSEVRSFDLHDRPAAAIVLTTGAVAGTWTDWRDLCSVTVGAGMAGRGHIHAHAHFEATTRGVNGGDRYMTETQIVRTRNGSDEVIEHATIYGPRHGHDDFWTTGDGFADATSLADTDMSKILAGGDCRLGDIFKLQGRFMSQQAARSLRFTVEDTLIELAPVGR